MMTPAPRRRLLVLALSTSLAAMASPVGAQTNPFAVPGAPQAAATPIVSGAPAFTVTDIRVDGLQRIGAGTVFTYLTIERGDTVDAARAAQAIRDLYKTGFFEDIRLDRQGSILVVTVVERPAINQVTITGNKDIKTEDLMRSLKDVGMSEGETYNPLTLDRMTQELTRAYNNRGKYNVTVRPTVSRLDRNRVDIAIVVAEGTAARIRHINLVGNTQFSEEDIRKGWESRESNWLSWYRRDDQYSRQKLEGDLERLSDFYLDRGYIDFSVDSTQVQISPDKRDMFITAGLTEGTPYTVSGVTLSGDMVLPQEDLQRLLLVKPGDTFSRRLFQYSSQAIEMSLANIGYAFARVNAVPTVDRDKRTVGIDMQVVPGPRVMVRQIQFRGNTRTSDEVMRREMRQFENAWYSQVAIDRSKVRLQRLGYFESVDVANVPVPGSPDQVDVVYTVKETSSGSFTFGLGYSRLSGMTLTAQISQANFLGTGNTVSAEIQRNRYMKRYSFGFMNPYFTDDGVSLGYNLWWRNFDNSNFNTAQFSSSSGAAQMVMGIPITENDSVSLMFGIDRNQIFATPGVTPQSMVDYIDAFGKNTFHSWRTQLAWARDTRNDFFQPTMGTYQTLSAEITLPGSTAEYYKISYQFSRYWPLSRALVLNTRFELGYGNSYGKDVTRNICWIAPTQAVPKPAITPPEQCTPSSPDYVRTVTATGLPFFENFYAGGTRSVRGFRDNTLGPRERAPLSSYSQPIGGAIKTVGSLEMFFPTLINSPAARLSAFVDFGNVFRNRGAFSTGDLRVSAGIALMWRAPVGPISISYAVPLRKQPGDEIEHLQFTFGGAF